MGAQTSITTSVYAGLADAPVIVTGGGGGIGAAFVEAFARQGAKVAFVDIDPDGSAKLAERLSDAAYRPIYRIFDLKHADGVPDLMADLISELGGLSVLVNNAGYDERHAIEDVTPKLWRDLLAVNLDHHFFCTQAAVPALAARGGSIVNMSSIAWRLGMGGMSAYVTAKAGIEGLTRGLARELGPKGIRVNCVLPGAVRTARQVEKWLTPEAEREISQGQSLVGWVHPEDVTGIVMFLASNDAKMITSQTFVVDGGWL
ncbi:SDR family NAD(P)-dependent oxidoreductase [Segnochrobactrum spirostomi]|uniref:SDR family oxidoreductase n=1 Tax=Segnochrobactrum spirostomi TaxID=2608987 RepID=A0A6A7Y5G8_9HYPH|nr:SDR family oxidoreductase [Segnochrobactrum spirostomi]MQT14434.1 SDR family oxidoreductase [Segnochrobactrum spirostomi]